MGRCGSGAGVLLLLKAFPLRRRRGEEEERGGGGGRSKKRNVAFATFMALHGRRTDVPHLPPIAQRSKTTARSNTERKKQNDVLSP